MKNNKGITLIALVVTIIVLIILAGVSINLTFGENGIITMAKRAKENIALAEIEEQKALNSLYLEMDNNNIGNSEEVVIESGIWRAKKSTESNSSIVDIYLYSIYYAYNPNIPELNKYKEQYIVKALNDRSEQEGNDLSFNNFDEMVLFFTDGTDINATEYASINDYIKANSINKTREEVIVEAFRLECETSEYANILLMKLGYTSENIAEIEKEYEECKNNQNIIEIPEEIKTATYVVTYPDGTTQEVLGSNLNSFKGTYNVQDNGNNIITITKLDEVTKLDVAVNNLRIKIYTDEWYVYTYDSNTDGYGVKVKDKTLTTYGQIKNDINGVPITSLYQTYRDCENVTSLSFEDFDTSKVTNMGGMFYGCSSLTSIDVSNFNTSKVTDMSFMFHYDSSLTSIDVSHFNTSNVTDMSCMFYGCSSLTSIDVSHFNTSKVTDMSSMFFWCNSLTSIDVSDFDTRNVTDMSFMFFNCNSLTSIDVSHFNTSNVTVMLAMFLNCNLLTSIDVSNFDTRNVTDMSFMFKNCSLLTSIDVSNFNTSNVTEMYGMFTSCSALTSIDVSNFNTSKATNMKEMFYNCSSLTSLDLSNFNTSKVTNMDSMFQLCSSLTTIYVGPNWTDANATITDMFTNCGTSTVTNKS